MRRYAAVPAGLMHSYTLTQEDAALDVGFDGFTGNPWAQGYLYMAALLLLARWVTAPETGPGEAVES